MAAIKFLIPPKFKGELTNIRIRFYNGRKFDISAQTGILINPSYWNNKSGKIRQRAEFTEALEYQKKLDDLKNSILKDFKDEPSDTIINKDWLLKAIDKFYNPSKYIQDNSLFGFIEEFIKNAHTRMNKAGNPVSKRTQDEYTYTFDLLKEYAAKYKEPDFIDMNSKFYNKFSAYLRGEGLANNTIGKKIKTLKTFLNDAFEKGINPYTKYKKFKVLSEDSDNIYLTVDEINQLYNLDLSDKPKLERVRDLFIIGCWTGLRYSDLKQLTPERIKGNDIELNQRKTGKKVLIPIHPTVREIINKYNGKLPAPISNQRYNDYLKELGKLSGFDEPFYKSTTKYGKKIQRKYHKYEVISSHTARRSFCTNAYKAGIPTLTIMAISGHRTETAFLKYIKVTQEEHANKMREMWQKEQSFLKVVK